MIMNSSNAHLLSYLVLLFCAIMRVKAVKDSRGGLEFKDFKLCGPSNPSNTEFKLSPWPFIPSKALFNLTIAFTPAEDIFAVTSEYILLSEPDGRILARGRDDMCGQDLNLCTLAAGEKYVYKYSDRMRAFPPGFKMTARAKGKLFNEEHIPFFCIEGLITIT
ncbi:unnamed protein product [Porites lobata]|uniref:MD-2-related lipid-recognition domain-containing protein n=1 Tax=Porites lobata TaxID=104759 RepID=A0ABN8N6F6_9CNID|nr:unnamed protein product [Porites lobata]